jgi:hypothetical protein
VLVASRCAAHVAGKGEAVAKFATKGVTGEIRFSPPAVPGGATLVTVALSGLSGAKSYSIHTNPINRTAPAADACSSVLSVGETFNPKVSARLCVFDSPVVGEQPSVVCRFASVASST